MAKVSVAGQLYRLDVLVVGIPNPLPAAEALAMKGEGVRAIRLRPSPTEE